MLATVWPDVSMLGATNLRRAVSYDFHHLRKKYDVLSMWGNIHNGDCYSSILKPKGLVGIRSLREKSGFFTNRSNQNQLWQLRQPAPPLEFPGEQGIFVDMYAQVREEEQVISSQFTRNQLDASMRRRKKRKQVEDGALIV